MVDDIITVAHQVAVRDRSHDPDTEMGLAALRLLRSARRGARTLVSPRRIVFESERPTYGRNFRVTFYFAIVIGIPTFSTLPIVVWNRILRTRNTVRSHDVSSME